MGYEYSDIKLVCRESFQMGVIRCQLPLGVRQTIEVEHLEEVCEINQIRSQKENPVQF